jgi:hypothetical protein
VNFTVSYEMQQPAEAKELYSEMIAACVAAFDDSEKRRNGAERVVQQLNLAVSGDIDGSGGGGGGGGGGGCVGGFGGGCGCGGGGCVGGFGGGCGCGPGSGDDDGSDGDKKSSSR